MKRVVSAIGVVLFTLLMLLFSKSPVLNILVSLVSALCLWEALVTSKYIESRLITALSLLVAVSVPFLTELPYKYLLLILLIYGFALFVTLIINYGKLKLEHICVVFMLSIVIPFFFSNIVMLRSEKGGEFYIYLIFIAAWFTDTCALWAGSLFGKHKLSPKISPNKTVEGAIGGIFGALVGFIVFGLVVQNSFGKDVNMTVLIIAAIITSIAGQLGDLSASLIKRSFGAKDFGTLIPGHGGMLDRFDSVLFVAPALHMIVLFLPFIK